MRNPRIYTYKITFEEVSYYYYGVHKETKYDEYYMGSPETHKWCWDFYTPKKQILELFQYTDEGWDEAQEIEKRIIRPFYQKDQLCLNENCGGKFSLKVSRKNGKKTYELGVGIHALSKEELSKNGKKTYELGIGIGGLTKEELIENGKKTYELGVGIHALSKEELSKNGKKSYELGVGIHALNKEQVIKNAKKGAKIVIEKYSKEFSLISPQGEVIHGRNINNFCREHGFDSANIRRVLKGTQSYYKGWIQYDQNKVNIFNFL